MKKKLQFRERKETGLQEHQFTPEILWPVQAAPTYLSEIGS